MSSHTPEGACDDDCGCVASIASTTPDRATKLLPTIELRTASQPIACTLQPDAVPERLERWHALLSTSTGRSRLPDGIRIEFPATTNVGDVSSLAAAESSCCSFFKFSVTIDSKGVILDARAPQDAQDLVTALFGDA